MKNSQIQKDYNLIRKVIDGDASAFRKLIFAYKDVSLSLAISILKDAIVAEDVLQEVFMKVYDKLHTFKFKASFATWLYRIVVNTCYNELKKRKNMVSIEHTSEVDSMVHRQKEYLKDADQKKYINMTLEKLKPDEALVLRLFYLCEYKIKEIEEITGFRSSKIKVNLHRGRDNFEFHLKQILGDDLNNLL